MNFPNQGFSNFIVRTDIIFLKLRFSPSRSRAALSLCISILLTRCRCSWFVNHIGVGRLTQHLNSKQGNTLQPEFESSFYHLLAQAHSLTSMDLNFFSIKLDDNFDAFELWFWRRLLRVPWTARRSNQSILKEINPEYSLEGQMLKLKLQYFDQMMQRANSLQRL